MPEKKNEQIASEFARSLSSSDDASRRIHAERLNKLTEVRAQSVIESAKGLALVNGGGAAALAAFLGQIWDKSGARPIRPYLLVAIGVLAIGVAIAAVLPYLRYRNSLDERSSEIGTSPWWCAHHYCTIFSVAAFVLGMGIAVCGGLRSL
jgi:hypothetical protein